MYESRFGITGPPFQLSPDPSFYFESRGHQHALAELRRAVAQETGFIAVTGAVGAGKTTLVRTLLGELDASHSVAHVVSTQLDPDELLGAALIGFGVPVGGAGPDELWSKLLRFLVKLDRDARRAILIIDEAQNLHRDAFHKLVQLATRKSPRALPFQVCLVGQPELRNILDSVEFATLRALITVSCHLGPISREETGAYIEHRLRKVGWSGVPTFEPGAFDEIFRWTGGIPRRINLLCNRLMLSRFLAAETKIDVATVAQTARDLRAEIGETDAEPSPTVAPSPGAAAAQRSAGRAPRLQDALVAPMEPGPLLCVAAGHGDHIKAAALMRAFAARVELPASKLVRVHNNDALTLSHALFAGIDVAKGLINLGIAEGPWERTTAELAKVFEFVVDHVLPRAVIVFDAGDAALSCARVASAKDVPVVHIGAGLRAGDTHTSDFDARRATDEISDLLYTTDAQATETLVMEGVPPERVHCVGNLLMDAVQVAMRAPAASTPARAASGTADPFLIDRTGYALVVLNKPFNMDDRRSLGEMLSIVRDVSRDIRLVWPVQARLESSLKKYRLEGLLVDERIWRLPPQPYPDYIALLRSATCVLTDSWSAQEEATALGVPCLTFGTYPERPITVSIGSNLAVGTNRMLATRAVWECIFNGGKRGRVPELWDGRTGARIAGYLSAWLPETASERRTAP